MKFDRIYLLALVASLSFVPTSFSQKVDMDLFHGLKIRNIGPAGMSGRVTSIDVVLNDIDQVYIGTAAGGIFKSENSGHTWKPIFENELAASIGAIAIYQKNPDIIYVGTGEGNPRNSQNSGWGMFKSIDGGKSWLHLGLENTRQIHRVIVHPDNPDHVVIGVSGASWGESRDRGIYKTTDGGVSWNKVLYINETTGCSDLVVDPFNPNKMIAGMWQHRRWPWFFKSGGEGSGMYISYDGGDNWEQTPEGLPKEELGRIGLSFAPSKKDWIYAYVESSDNAIYKSEDGGRSWKRQSKKGDRNIGDRPFYYADIYVDIKNENRIYSIASTVTSSEDGGKSWSVFAPGNKIHTDHHAWWAHPDDPEYLMVGHDGGLNITHDRGKNWTFAENLPLGQFYHVSVDNEFPYNIYGGLQDNGSWKGPSQTWFKGGIRNMYWQRLSVGDGFDVVPDPKNPDFGYAMGQAGNLIRYQSSSGQLTRIKPVHPKGEYLRFNWNAGIAINPHDRKTIYYGSQYVHKSSNYGKSWDIISPDLTTNDPQKQEFLESGGLSYDVTGAEFHTTIISIAPSPVDEDVIWVGTDDGNVQITKDGGKNWDNVVRNIKGVAANSWVAQVQASDYDADEAFIVFDDHRRNNWEPYVYHTKNGGKSWSRLVDSEDVRGYVYCFEQDPVEPNLMFVGTEFGLYVSFDAGKIWNQWTNKLPTMPISDMVIHPREHDLVIGTFGRSFWVLDDIRPLREMAQEGVRDISRKDLYVFPVTRTHLMIIGESFGYRQGKIGDALYEGENRPYGALISFHANLEEGAEEKASIVIKNEEGSVVRNWAVKAKNGVNRINWNLRSNSKRPPNAPKPKKDADPGTGFYAPPGNYVVEVTMGEISERTSIAVLKDPRLEISDIEIQEKQKKILEYEAEVGKVTAMMDELRSWEKSMGFVKGNFENDGSGDAEDFDKKMKEFSKELTGLKESVTGKQVQGIYRNPEVLTSVLFSTNFALDHPLVPFSSNQKNQMKLFKDAVKAFEKRFEKFEKGPLKEFRKEVDKIGVEIF